ncbi:MAG TPA: hypothetical protein VFK80_02720, partial [Limnochordia bacterium]|nr:hypothetical protein [Limnochordia bacterium]
TLAAAPQEAIPVAEPIPADAPLVPVAPIVEPEPLDPAAAAIAPAPVSEPAVQPEPLAARAPAAPEEIKIDLEAEVSREKARDEVTPPRKSRAAKKAELQERIEDEVEVVQEDEVLPSLFEGAKEKVDVVEETVFVAGGDDDPKERGKKRRKGRDDKSERTILHDLSDLARLLGEE